MVDITIHAEIDNVVTKGEQAFVNDDVVNLSLPKYLQSGWGDALQIVVNAVWPIAKGVDNVTPKKKVKMYIIKRDREKVRE